MLLNEEIPFVGRGDFVFQVKPDGAVSANILTATAVDAPFKVTADDAMGRGDINDSDTPRWANIGTATAASAFVRINDHSPTKAGLGRAGLKGIGEGYSPCPQRQQKLFDL